MKNYLMLFGLWMLALFLGSCSAIAGIFKTGMGVGIVITIAVILVIVMVIARAGKK